jgi:hypothetical protein
MWSLKSGRHDDDVRLKMNWTAKIAFQSPTVAVCKMHSPEIEFVIVPPH